MKAAPGDMVYVKGTVSRNDRQNGYVSVSFRGDLSVWISESDIVHVERAPLKVGDRVTWRGDAAQGTIIAIDTTTKPLAWIGGPSLANGYGLIVFLDELERA